MSLSREKRALIEQVRGMKIPWDDLDASELWSFTDEHLERLLNAARSVPLSVGVEEVARIVCYWSEPSTCHDAYCSHACIAVRPDEWCWKAAQAILSKLGREEDCSARAELSPASRSPTPSPAGQGEPMAWWCHDLLLDKVSIIDDAEHAARRASYPDHWEVLPLYPSPRSPEAQCSDGWVLVPREPPMELLMSMAVRQDHGLGAPGYYDQDFFGAERIPHARRVEAALQTMAQVYEEVVGAGFYRPENADRYRAMIEAAPPPPPQDGVAFGRAAIVPTEWVCGCGSHAWSPVDERKHDGSFGPGPLIRCVGCKTVSQPTQGEEKQHG